ncbi:MAG: hypothetical protein LWX07_02090 [Bacteroidetes bacterium]|nr:hypothetical protein [Bacteroidota bacterium]
MENHERKNKVAEIVLIFWLLKIVATTLGETLGDFISMTLNLGYTVGIAITFAFFFVVLFTQLSVKKYISFIYWLVIIGTTTLGTEISDYIDRSLHLGYTAGTILLVSCLGLVLFLWYLKYKNLEVFPVTGRWKEIYYWTAILFSNSLGTAFGDFLGEYFGMSFLQGALVTGGVILVVVLLHYLTKINHIILFWIAFVFTRPFGATFGDFLTKTPDEGGLHLGTLESSLVSVGVMSVLLLIEYRRNKLHKNIDS